MNAKVEISLADLDTLRNAKAKAESDLVDLRRQYDALRTSVAGVPTDEQAAAGDDIHSAIRRLGDGPNLALALNHSLEVVRFAVSALDPLTVRGWPHKNLLALAELLPKVPGITEFTRELWLDWRIFARRAGEWEDARARGAEQEKLAEENAAKVPGSRYGEMPGEQPSPE